MIKDLQKQFKITREIIKALDKKSVLASRIKPETLENDVLDIVFLDSPRVPLELKMHIVRNGKVIFDAAPIIRMNFESRIML